ncbi:NmrA-like family protein [Xylariomycetidae sp. FL0641]|nr:NmrA-like family protein [Xylariomycetidae sp. FL0641]
MAIQTVALFGATGSLGSAILSALTSASPAFTVTVIQRSSSSSKAPTTHPGTRLATVDDELSLPSLQAALAGHDAVVVAFRSRDVAQQQRISEAAFAAGVRRVIPADYGSCDSASARAQELVPLFGRKTAVRERLQALSEQRARESNQAREFSWTSIVCGHFFDWGLREGFLHFDLKGKRADILDDGSMKSSTATLDRVALAVVRILQREEQTRNRVLYIQSFCVSQLEVLRALERATGTQWQVTYHASETFIREHKAKADKGDADAIEDLVFALGAVDGNWETRDGFAMEMLGLENEDLDHVVTRTIESEAS